MAYIRRIRNKYWVLSEKYFDNQSEKWKERLIKSLGKINKRDAQKILYEYESNRVLQQFDICNIEDISLSKAIGVHLKSSGQAANPT